MWVNILKCKFIDWVLLKGFSLISGKCQNYENLIQGNLWGKRKELVTSRALLIWIPKWALGSNNDVLEFPVRHFFFLMRTACPAASPTLYDMFLICLMKNKHQSWSFPRIRLPDVEAHTYLSQAWNDWTIWALGSVIHYTLNSDWPRLEFRWIGNSITEAVSWDCCQSYGAVTAVVTWKWQWSPCPRGASETQYICHFMWSVYCFSRSVTVSAGNFVCIPLSAAVCPFKKVF